MRRAFARDVVEPGVVVSVAWFTRAPCRPFFRSAIHESDPVNVGWPQRTSTNRNAARSGECAEHDWLSTCQQLAIQFRLVLSVTDTTRITSENIGISQRSAHTLNACTRWQHDGWACVED
jgi:hypothetical protein